MSWAVVAVSAVSVGASVYSGVSTNKSAKASAKLQEQQGQILKEEAYVEAAKTRDEGYRFAQEQAMAYISSGVEIQGTPLLLANETISKAEFEAKALEKRGNAQMDLSNAQAKITRNEGRSALIGGILNGGSSALKGAKDMGMFTSSSANNKSGSK